MFTAQDLAHFTGTNGYFFNPLARQVKYTDGVKFISDNGAAWFVSDLVIKLATTLKLAAQPFVAITIKVKNRKASVEYTDGNGNKVIRSNHYEFTDFPINELKLFYTNGVLMLASEY